MDAAASETEVLITATSPISFEDAIAAGVSRATATLRGVQDVLVKDQQALVEGGNIVGYRVDLVVTFVPFDEALQRLHSLVEELDMHEE